ncbi:MAG: hypothetical protein ABI132_09805 [Rhodanobacteraceae bacterium]
MELDEMKAAWQELNERVVRNDAVSMDIRKELKLDKAKSALRRWLWLPAVELGFGVATAVVASLFLARNAGAIDGGPPGVIPALILFVLGLATVVASICQLALVAGIDYTAPVVAIQRRLLKVRALRIRMTQCDLLFGLPLWPVFLAFALQCMGGYAAYRAFDSAWLVWNVLFGLLLAGLLVWASRRYAARLSRSIVVGKLADEIAGRGLAAAAGHLDEVARFVRE